jgi:peroxiredoxin
MNKKAIIAIIVLGLLAVAAGIYMQQQGSQQAITHSTSQMPGKTEVLNSYRPDFELRDYNNQLRNMNEWNGKVVLINFWASWCPPCRREMPAFVKLRETYGKQGFEVVGIAIDQLDLAEAFSDTIGAHYPLLWGENDAIEVSKNYGNRFGQLPYSLIIDRKGIIRFIRRGELTYENAEEIIKSLL